MFGEYKTRISVPVDEIKEMFEYLTGEKAVDSEEVNKAQFNGYEEHDYEQFKSSHVCPDRKPHDNIEYGVTISYSYASSIGTNTYVKCERCGCMQDITDYGMW